MLTQLPANVIELIVDNIVGEDVFIEQDGMPAYIAKCNALARDVLALGVCLGTRFNLHLLRLHDRTMDDLRGDIEGIYRIIHRIVNANDHRVIHKEFVEFQCNNIHVGKLGGRSIDTSDANMMFEYMELCPEVYRNRTTFLSLSDSSQSSDDYDRIYNHVDIFKEVYIHEINAIDEVLYHLEIFEGFAPAIRMSRAREKILYQLAHANSITS